MNPQTGNTSQIMAQVLLFEALQRQNNKIFKPLGV